MSIVAKAFRVAAAVLNAVADLEDGRTRRPRVATDRVAAQRAGRRFDAAPARQAERARQTDLLIALSQRIGQAGNRRAWESLRTIAPCARCGDPACTCR